MINPFQRPRILCFLLVSLFVVFCDAEESKTPAKKETITLKVFTLPFQNAGSPKEMSAYRVVERFKEKYPHINLISSTKLRIKGKGTDDSGTLMSIAGGTAPDVIKVNFRQSDTYISKGFLYPLDEYIAQLPPDELNRYVPPQLHPVIYRKKSESKDKSEHYWMFPEKPPTTMALKYRRDRYILAGLDPEITPKTWPEVLEYAKKVTDPAKGVYAFGVPQDHNISYWFFSFICSAGAKAVTQLPNGEWRATFDSEEAVTAYEFLDRIFKTTVIKDGKTFPICMIAPHEEVTRALNDGKIVMNFVTLSQTRLQDSATNQEMVGVGMIPTGPTGLSRSAFDCDMLGIFAGQKDKKVRDAAWEYIKFMDSEEARKIYTQTNVEFGAAKVVSPRWLKKYGFPDLAEQSPADVEHVFEESLKSAVPEPYGKDCQFIYPMMTYPLEQIMRDKSLALDLSMDKRREKIKAYLTQATARANEKFGVVTPEQRRSRNMIGWTSVSVAALGFFFLIWKIFSWMNLQRPPISTDSASTYRNRIAALLILPALLLIFTWDYYPLFRGSLMSFQDFSLMGDSKWVGIDNFSDVLHDPDFWHPLKTAFYFCVLWILMGFLPPLFLAILLQEIPRGKVLFRVLYYLPAVISGILILFMWAQIFKNDDDGILNRILATVGLPAQQWLNEPRGALNVFFDLFHIRLPDWIPGPSFALFCVVFPMAWAHLGPGCIIYLAALKGIPDELYEAADIDGASFWNKIRYIIVPYMKPLLVINLVGATIHGFKSGANAILAMTGGGPLKTTHVIGYEVFERTFMFLEFGHGTAIAWILGMLLLSFTAYQLKILNKVEFRTANR